MTYKVFSNKAVAYVMIGLYLIWGAVCVIALIYWLFWGQP